VRRQIDRLEDMDLDDGAIGRRLGILPPVDRPTLVAHHPTLT
jgi:hypothetical protein